MLAAAMDGATGDMGAPKGAGRLLEGRERFIRAMMAVEFDGRRWLGQFGAADAAHLQPVLLAMAPVNTPGAEARGMDLIRELVQDPVYQLK
jgi:hypothetical protein